jgi:hypothetical protein
MISGNLVLFIELSCFGFIKYLLPVGMALRGGLPREGEQRRWQRGYFHAEHVVSFSIIDGLHPVRVRQKLVPFQVCFHCVWSHGYNPFVKVNASIVNG